MAAERDTAANLGCETDEAELSSAGSDQKRMLQAIVSSKRTKKFDVSNTGMVDLPAQIEQMTWLKDLNICDNGLVRLPPQISTLNLVEHLNLARNRLTTLPKEIGGMRMLRSLDITGNKIRALPLELGLCQVPTLEHFRC